MTKEDSLSKEKQPGNIFQFAQNKHYYDSLDSVEVLRNEQPQYFEPKGIIDDGESDTMLRIN